MDEEAICSHVQGNPPGCVNQMTCVAVEQMGPPKGACRVAWNLSCPCGDRDGEIHGYRLGDLKPGFQDWDQLVSPLVYLCRRCNRQIEILDTAVHGFGSESAKLVGGMGGVAYRGEGPKTAFACPTCRTTKWHVTLTLAYDDSSIWEFLSEQPGGVTRPEDYFDHYHLTGCCLGCGKESVIASIDTK